jgi:N-acetylmuramoyl-L-alanine amidase
MNLLQKSVLLLLFSFFFTSQLICQDYLQATPKKGDGVLVILKRYNLPTDSSYIKKFISLNKKNLTNKDEIILDKTYSLPIALFVFDGTTIRSSLGIDDYNHAKKIQDYNNLMFEKKLKSKSFKTDNILWVPIHLLDDKSSNNLNIEDKKPIEIKEEVIKQPDTKQVEQVTTVKPVIKQSNSIFGKKYKNIPKINTKLSGYVFYLDPGHGGIDPGAIGEREGHEMTEDEYAYDVTLRLAHRLMQYGATVFMLVIDSTDGIRDEKYLKNNTDEYFGNGKSIQGDAKDRLQKRIDYLTTIHNKLAKSTKERLIVIHVDSRDTSHRVDVFFYHNPGDEAGKKYAENMMTTLNSKYEKSQPGRGYKGSVTDRNLFMLRNSPVLSVYIELGNIQNDKDQLRFINPNNRQAIANWLADGILVGEKIVPAGKKAKSKK